MVRGTFGNIRLRNEMTPGQEGAWTLHLPTNEVMSVFDASRLYQGGRDAADRDRRQGVRHGQLARLGGQGASCCGVQAVIAESYERIHRSNLVMMGVLPLQFKDGEGRSRSG